ncbi:MAG: ABC transporter ATP-binding protein [bacterium]
MIKLENLSKTFGNVKAVNNISLEIKGGEFFCLLGPNGAGKTTTLKLITGLLKPSGGRVTIGGYDVNKEPIAAKRLLGYIPDIPFLYDKLTPIEFLSFIKDLYGADNDGENLLSLFEMSDYKDTLIEEFSHGMKQRICFCAMLLHNPSYIVIDEPMVGLDPKSIHLVKAVLKERTKDGAAVILSTHQLSLAEELSDKVSIIHKGRIVAEGSPSSLKDLQKKESLEDAFLEITK